MAKYYKITSPEGEPVHGGRGVWSLPVGEKPGDWMPAVDVVPCESGYHVCEVGDLPHWIKAGALWEVEGRGKMVRDANKTVFASARLLRMVGLLDDRTLRLFAADCAARVLKHFESVIPGDSRPRDAILASRAFARRKIDSAACYAADYAADSSADSAACYETDAAAKSAAYAAAYCAADSAADFAADSAADFAADSAVDSAAYAAARSAEYTAQGELLIKWAGNPNARCYPLPPLPKEQRTK